MSKRIDVKFPVVTCQVDEPYAIYFEQGSFKKCLDQIREAVRGSGIDDYELNNPRYLSEFLGISPEAESWEELMAKEAELRSNRLFRRAYFYPKRNPNYNRLSDDEFNYEWSASVSEDPKHKYIPVMILSLQGV